MGDVFLAVGGGAAGATKLAVVKRLKPEFWDNPDFQRMFEAEARLATRIQHRNCVQVLDVDHDESGALLIAMEYIQGQSLSRIFSHFGMKNIPLRYGVWILREVLAGVHYSHELKDFSGKPLELIHRDVTPPNVMVSYDGDVKLIDFGIAKSMASIRDHTKPGALKGKAAFLAPEQICSPQVLDRRVDVFGAGVMLWGMLAGKRMWAGASILKIIGELSKGKVPRLPEECRSRNPLELCEICDRATAVDPEERFDTAEEMRSALDRWLASEAPVSADEIREWLHEGFAAERARVEKAIAAELSRMSLPAEDQEAPKSLPVLAAKPLTTENARPSTAASDSVAPRPTVVLRWLIMGLAAALVIAIGIPVFNAVSSSPAKPNDVAEGREAGHQATTN